MNFMTESSNILDMWLSFIDMFAVSMLEELELALLKTALMSLKLRIEAFIDI